MSGATPPASRTPSPDIEGQITHLGMLKTGQISLNDISRFYEQERRGRQQQIVQIAQDILQETSEAAESFSGDCAATAATYANATPFLAIQNRVEELTAYKAAQDQKIEELKRDTEEGEKIVSTQQKATQRALKQLENLEAEVASKKSPLPFNEQFLVLARNISQFRKGR